MFLKKQKTFFPFRYIFHSHYHPSNQKQKLQVNQSFETQTTKNVPFFFALNNSGIYNYVYKNDNELQIIQIGFFCFLFAKKKQKNFIFIINMHNGNQNDNK